MKRSECTTVIVGKKASMDGSIMIARNEDCFCAINRKKFVVYAENEVENRVYVSENNKLNYELPNKALRYTAVPSEDKEEPGQYAEAGINELNVAISSTESLYGNPLVLAYDPNIAEGVCEDAINDVVLPFVKSAREGIEFLGELVKKYGSAEGNGIIFSDENEVWYMEIPTGHHWVAQRIPDDSYAVAANHVCIEEVDFDDKANFMYSDGIKEFVEKYKLNPYKKGFNFRKIFGTYDELDRHYNTPREWYIHKMLSGEEKFTPSSGEIPFIQKTEKLFSQEDIMNALSSHFNETVYDPIGYLGNEKEKTMFRSVSLSRTSESHILQTRAGVHERLKGIMWLSFATNAFTPYVPFFTYVNESPKQYSYVSEKIDLNCAYWLFKIFSYYADEHIKLFNKETKSFLYTLQTYGRKRVLEITEGMTATSDEDIRKYLTEENQKTADYVTEKIKEKLDSYAKRALSESKLSYDMDKNL